MERVRNLKRFWPHCAWCSTVLRELSPASELQSPWNCDWFSTPFNFHIASLIADTSLGVGPSLQYVQCTGAQNSMKWRGWSNSMKNCSIWNKKNVCALWNHCINAKAEKYMKALEILGSNKYQRTFWFPNFQPRIPNFSWSNQKRVGLLFFR